MFPILQENVSGSPRPLASSSVLSPLLPDLGGGGTLKPAMAAACRLLLALHPQYF